MSTDFPSPSEPTPAALRIRLFLLAWFPVSVIALLACVCWLSSGTTPDDKPVVVDAAVREITASGGMSFAGTVRSVWRESEDKANRQRFFKETMSDRAEHAFGGLSVEMYETDFRDFPSLLNSSAHGFRDSRSRVKLVRSDATSEPMLRHLERLEKIAAEFRDTFKDYETPAEFYEKFVDRNHASLETLIAELSGTDAKDAEPTALFGQGYLIDEEHREELHDTSTPIFKKLGVFSAPVEIDPRGWHHLENQGQIGSCQGQALSSTTEMALFIAAGGRASPEQLSRFFAYLGSQRNDGIMGRDVGSTLAGGLALVKDVGLCPENLIPYPHPARYPNNPEQIYQRGVKAAGEFKIRRHTVCKSYRDVFDFLASGQGGVEIGIRWPDSWMNCSGVIEEFQPGNGGHAVCFLGYSKREDSAGRKYLWLANSWGEDWGNGGYAEVAPRAVDQMCRHSDTVMIGLSDMAKDDIKPRDVSWIGKKNPYRGVNPKTTQAP